MSRVSTIEKLYAKPQKSALEFDYDSLWAPPINSLLSYEDIQELYRIATSVKLSGSINKKYQLLDTVMKRRGFRPDHKGTNRVTYRFLEDPRFIAKVAVDRVGIQDSPAEYKNQEFLKPFCCKIFEVDPTGVVAFVERVNPITSLQEFASVSDDIFNMMITKIIGKYVVDDLGTTKFMNYGIRMRNGCAFGPVVIDFPYVYELDGAKLVCQNILRGTNQICNGEIDYDAGMNHLVCKRCGREYSAKDLKKNEIPVLKIYGESDRRYTMRARIVNDDGTVIMDSGRTSRQSMSKEEMQMINVNNDQKVTRVSKTHKSKHNKKETALDMNRKFYQERIDAYNKKLEEQKMGPFNPVIKPRVTKATVHNSKNDEKPEDTTPATSVVNPNQSTKVTVTHYRNEAAIREAIPELQNKEEAEHKTVSQLKSKLESMGFDVSYNPNALDGIKGKTIVDVEAPSAYDYAELFYKAMDADAAGDEQTAGKLMRYILEDMSKKNDEYFNRNEESKPEEDTADLTEAIMDGVREALNEETHYSVDDDDEEEDDTDMDEVDEVPESDEIDYSDYDPEEESYDEDDYEDPDDKYQEYADKFEREERKSYNKKKRSKYDMSDY